MMATIILMLVLVLLIGGSDGSEAPICGTEAPWFHASEFPGYVENALNNVVGAAAGNYQTPDQAQTTDVESSTFYPDNHHGSAWAAATCYAGVTPADCTQCLSDLLPYVQACKKKTQGGAFVQDRCWLRFQEYMP